MNKIEVLDQNTIDKIAAGEVVERPSSVVKELVENAIDAGATAVTVEIKEGGCSMIRITDNGCGIDWEEAPVAFLRHATSKIRKVEDLEQIASLGFRGEALSSIAAVAQVDLITKTQEAISGLRYVIEGGIEKEKEEIGAPEGTTFLVRNLFFNVPARKKFLKSAATEAGYVNTLMEQLALSNPDISFKYMQNGQVKLHTSGNGQIKDVIYQIYGRDISKELLELHYENDFMEIDGYIGKPNISRGNRNFENYYINGRFVKDKIVAKAIEDAYKDVMMHHKFPFVSLKIEMKGNDLDVNVHPSKMEVRFSRGMEVYDSIYEAIWNKLHHRELIPKVSIDADRRGREKGKEQEEASIIKKEAVPEPFENHRRQAMQEKAAVEKMREKPAPMFEKKPDVVAESKPTQRVVETRPEERPVETQKRADEELIEVQQQEIISEIPDFAAGKEETENKVQEIAEYITDAHEKTEKPAPRKEVSPPLPEMEVQELPPEIPSYAEQQSLFEAPLLSQEARISHRLIGQVFDTYWLVEYKENLYLIDQHAAHERMYYERFVKDFKNRSVTSQYVSPPLIVTLSAKEEQILKEHEQVFEQYGFEINSFGGKEYAISAVPAELLGRTSEDLFIELLDHLDGNQEKTTWELFAGRLATMACKSAVKGNQKLSTAEADQLIEELLNLENPYHCPHGRPTIISMSKYEIEKKFKRIVS